MFIAMNHFQVAPGKGPDFERVWRERESHLQDVPGFVQFVLLKSEAEGEYISHSTWQDRATFTAWTESEAFIAAHRQGSLKDIVAGPAHLKLYEGVVVETPAGRTQLAS